MNPLESQVGGSHYKDMKIQPAEFCHANGIPYLEGCAIKYICRHRAKNKAEDVRKAIHFLELLLKLEYGADEQTEPVRAKPDIAYPSALNIQLDALHGPQGSPAVKSDMRVACLAQSPNEPHLICTLCEGHAGPHMAFACGDKPEQVWEQ